MKQSVIRASILCTALALLMIPVSVYADNSSRNSSRLQMKLSEKIKADTIELHKKVNELESPKKLRQESRQHASDQQRAAHPHPSDVAAEPVIAEKKKLTDAQKKVCLEKQDRINTIIHETDAQRQKTFDHITKISDAAQTFYRNKQLSVDNYNELVAAVDNAKVAANNAKEAQLQVPPIDCNTTTPHDNMVEFRQKRTESLEAMRLYRDAVKILVNIIREAYLTTSGTKS